MHLRSITLRGFKSFADRTTVELDRGLAAVVGPNGAGKSNLIDALVWSLGTLSTRSLRAERMEDVIFTGTVERKPLGMAQVVLTLDNSDATFPLDFSEVQIGRTLYRDGASEYSINGTACRLLDIQELLAEAGLGRELHAVVAQGQVDEIVQSKPEELRAYVEEAAGIAKHRRRKDRAVRKIDQVSGDIDRVADLANELRRQLRPLRAQAEQARRHTDLTDRLREIRIRKLVGELEGLERERKRALESHEGTSEALAELRASLDELRSTRMGAERRLDDSRRESSSTRKGLEHLRSAQAAALRSAIVMRERSHAQPDVRRRDAIVAKERELDSDETEVRASLEALARELGEREAQIAGLRQQAGELRSAKAEAEERLRALSDDAAGAEASARAAEQAEITARAEAQAAAARGDRAAAQRTRLEEQASVIRREIEGLDAAQGHASIAVERIEGERREALGGLEDAERKLRELDAEAAVLRGRAETLRVALELAAERRKGAETLRQAHGGELDARGVLGELIRVPSGLERAVEAVLGPVLDALVVAGARAPDAVERAEMHRADVLVVPTIAAGDEPAAVGGARPLARLIDAPSWLRGTIDVLCEGTYVVERAADARSLSAQHPHATFVASSGRVISGRGVSRPAPSGAEPSLALKQALERAEQGANRVTADRGRYATATERYRANVRSAENELTEARAELAEIEARIAAAADRLREIGESERAAALENELAQRDHTQRLRAAAQAAHTQQTLAAERREIGAATDELRARINEFASDLARIDEELWTADTSRTEALTVQASLNERLRGIGRVREELARERGDIDAGPTDPEDLRAGEELLASLDELVATTEQRVRELLDAEERVENELRELTENLSRTEVQVASLEPRSLHASEEVTRFDIRIEEIGSRLAHDFDIPPSRAREEFPPAAGAQDLDAEERRLDRELRRMGPVNPLAAREISALDERREFLETQLEDLRSSKRDLLRLVRAADTEMRELLVRATEDANHAFQDVLALLFPEGGGRLRLAGADDPLEAGIEIEVRLGRKGHRRLSFLSGGEKALAGLGFLFALHVARPTPFLVLDEVDAPLDDANLGRFLRLLDSFRERTQVVVISHQKRTMERADTLIGVTLNPDGTSRVVTQQLSERERAEVSEPV